MNKEEIERRLIEGIRDNYTLNLAISILEDLDIANKKLDKIREHVENSKFYYKDEDSEEIYEDYYPSATDILSIIGGE